MVCMYIIIHTFMTNPKSNPGKSSSKPKPQPGRQEAQPTELLRTRFSARQLQRHFAKLLTASWLATWLELSERAFYQRAYTPLITLWYLLFQRLSDNHTLSHVVEDAREGGADHLSPRGKTPSSQQLTSEGHHLLQRCPSTLAAGTPAPSPLAHGCSNCCLHPGTQMVRVARGPDRRFDLPLAALGGHSRALPPTSARQLQKTALLVSGARPGDTR